MAWVRSDPTRTGRTAVWTLQCCPGTPHNAQPWHGSPSLRTARQWRRTRALAPYIYASRWGHAVSDKVRLRIRQRARRWAVLRRSGCNACGRPGAALDAPVGYTFDMPGVCPLSAPRPTPRGHGAVGQAGTGGRPARVNALRLWPRRDRRGSDRTRPPVDLLMSQHCAGRSCRVPCQDVVR
jgi:hypothetical protein